MTAGPQTTVEDRPVPTPAPAAGPVAARPAEVVSLLYHDVYAPADESGPARSASGFMTATAAPYKLTFEAFEEHLAALAGAGRAAPPLDGMGDLAPGRAPVLLTFDDGGVSAHSVIAPLLEARGWRGHFFVVTDEIGRDGFMTADQVRDLHRRGHVVGSHTCSHPERMSTLSDDELRYEWGHSVAVLSDVLGARVDTASVPNGYYSRRVGVAAAAAGIRWLFTSEPTLRLTTVAGCTLLGRFHVQAHTPAATVADLVAERSVSRARQRLHWSVKKVAKAVGGSGYLAFRSFALRQRVA